MQTAGPPNRVTASLADIMAWLNDPEVSLKLVAQRIGMAHSTLYKARQDPRRLNVRILERLEAWFPYRDTPDLQRPAEPAPQEGADAAPRPDVVAEAPPAPGRRRGKAR